MSNFEYRKITTEDKRRIVEDMYKYHPKEYIFNEYYMDRLKRFVIDIAVNQDYESYIFSGMHIHAGASIVKDYTFFYKKNLFLIEEVSAPKKGMLADLYLRELANPSDEIDNRPIGKMSEKDLQEMENCLITAYLCYNKWEHFDKTLVNVKFIFGKAGANRIYE